MQVIVIVLIGTSSTTILDISYFNIHSVRYVQRGGSFWSAVVQVEGRKEANGL
jgi:hypothetical protein